MGLGNQLKHAWNAFRNREPTTDWQNMGPGYAYRPDRPRLSRGNERSIVTAIITRIGIDVAAVAINHADMDADGQFIKIRESGLNTCISKSANTDQTGRAFMQDIVMSLLDEGAIAMVPVITTGNPLLSGSYDIQSMRTGKIVTWYPQQVRVSVYNELIGYQEEITLPKHTTGIVENPLYAIMNEPNSTMQRLIRKLNLLDSIDEQSGSGKLDLIVQVPYTIKTEARRKQADGRREEIEKQLSGSKYGIAYTDGTEKIVQLNRPVDNNLMSQIEYLTSMLYGQLGITPGVMNGTASEAELLNYHNRTIEPILSAIVDEMERKFLTKTARSQNQAIVFFRDPFKLASINSIAEMADKFTRNEIMSSNEMRQKIGIPPSRDPKADELRNSNLSAPKEEETIKIEETTETKKEDKNQNG